MFNIRTDLAMEAHEIYRDANSAQEPPGVEVETFSSWPATVTRVKVNTSEGERAIGKPIGKYVTIEIPPRMHREQKIFESICEIVQTELLNMMNIGVQDTVLIVGLGNLNITPDALGPKVVESVLITRHMTELVPEEIEGEVRPTCAVSPGVLGTTGIESSEIIYGVVQRVKPKLVIVIDALASRKVERISTTIQIADTGISPGSGIGNKRKALNKETLGIPVIAIGVPTVVDAATMASDVIDTVIEQLIKQNTENSQFYNVLKNVKREEKYSLIADALELSTMGNMVVTPKEVDNVIDDMAELIANGINIALHEGVSIRDLNKYA